MSSLQEVCNFLENLDEDNIIFTWHFFERTYNCPVSEELVRKYLGNLEKLINAEEQPARRRGEKKYRLRFKLSNRYSLVIVVVIVGKILNVISAWNSDRKWQKAKKK